MPWTSEGWTEEGAGRSDSWMEFGPSGYPRNRLNDGGHPHVAGRNQPIHRPHYSDERFARGREHTLFGATERGLQYEYSDRLWQWDYAKAQESGGVADRFGRTRNSAAWWEVWLSYYFGKPVTLAHIIGGVNVSSGYEYYVFGFKDAAGDDAP